MKRNKLKAFLLLSPLLLTACSDENAKQCKTLINDEAMRSLSISFCEKAAAGYGGVGLKLTSYSGSLPAKGKLPE